MKGKAAETAEEAKQNAQSTFETIKVRAQFLCTQPLCSCQPGVRCTLLCMSCVGGALMQSCVSSDSVLSMLASFKQH